jgi:hypothetical protein
MNGARSEMIISYRGCFWSWYYTEYRVAFEFTRNIDYNDVNALWASVVVVLHSADGSLRSRPYIKADFIMLPHKY